MIRRIRISSLLLAVPLVVASLLAALVIAGTAETQREIPCNELSLYTALRGLEPFLLLSSEIRPLPQGQTAVEQMRFEARTLERRDAAIMLARETLNACEQAGK